MTYGIGDSKAALRKATFEKGDGMQIIIKDAPYAANRAIKEIGGKWNREDKVWIVTLDSKKAFSQLEEVTSLVEWAGWVGNEESYRFDGKTYKIGTYDKIEQM